MNSQKSKSTKVIIIILSVVGLILFCIGTIMGGSISSITGTFQGEELEDGAIPLADASPDQINEIELNLTRSDITFKTGRLFDVSGTGNYDSYVKDGVLYAGASSRKYYVSIFGQKLRIPSKLLCGFASYVVTIPTNAELESIVINTTFCNITGDSLKAKNITIDNHFGDTEITSLETSLLNAKQNFGTFTANHINVEDSSEIKAFGKISLGLNSEENSVINNLTAKNTWGDITIHGRLQENNLLSTALGDIFTNLSGSPTNYTLESDKDNLTIDSGTESEESLDFSGTITYQCNRGKGKVSFQ